jgi:alpha-beta hydrolase superfamily lysophospholipase
MFPRGSVSSSSFALQTGDGVAIRAQHWPSASGRPERSPDLGMAIVVAHGFTGALGKPALQTIARRLTAFGGVFAFDFRGHGRSGGFSTLGDDEVLDVDAVVAAARSHGYARVVTVGFSMGGAAVIRHAALVGVRTSSPVDAVATISAVSRWYRVETAPMRRLHWAVQTRAGRRYAQYVLGTRIAAEGWSPAPAPPDAVVGRIAPVPLLLVHGDRDPYLTMDNAHDLYAAAGEPVTLWVWPGFGHAESAMNDERTDRLGAALDGMARGRRAEEWPSG